MHPGLKRITKYHWLDDFNVFEYNLQPLKKIEGVDRASLIFKNFIDGSLVHSLICDKYQPLYRYNSNQAANPYLDYHRFKPLFDAMQGELSSDYRWFALEKRFKGG